MIKTMTLIKCLKSIFDWRKLIMNNERIINAPNVRGGSFVYIVTV